MSNKNLIIGIDLGVSSCGWAIYNKDTKINEKQGVYLFDPANEAVKRRNARGLRRRYNRRKYRLLRLKKLLEENNLIATSTIDPYLLDKRIKGLNEKIEIQDIVNILYYFIRQRGYIPFEEGKDGVENHKIAQLETNKNKYPCEIQKIILEQEGKFRSTQNKFLWKEYQREIKQILKIQQQFYNQITEEFVDKYFKIYNSKRNFWEGPGAPNEKELSSYGRYRNLKDLEEYRKNPNYRKFLYEDLIGNCSIYEGEKRVPVSNYYAQYFNFFNDMVNLSFNIDVDENNSEYFYKDKNTIRLSFKGIEKIKDEVIKANSVTYKNIFKKIGVDLFNISGYRLDNGKPDISKFEFLKKILKQCNEEEKQLLLKNIDKYNQLAYILAVYQGIDLKFDEIKKLNIGLSEETMKKIATMKTTNFNKYHSFSEKALIVYLEKMELELRNSSYIEKKYPDYINETVKSYKINNYPSKKITTKYIDEIIANPQVKKSLRKAIYIINTLLDEYGDRISAIAIESNTEILNDKQKNKYNEIMEGNREKRLNIIKNYPNANNNEIEKRLLLEESNYSCCYCEHPVTFENMQVDHIIPFSISCDDSYANKVSCCNQCNNDKDNNSPYGFLKQDFSAFKERIEKNKNYSDEKKKNLFTMEDISNEKYSKRFINRNLRDTAYATKELVSQLKLFKAANNKYDFDIVSVPPKITGIVRKEIEKDRDLDYHHAQDATIIAAYLDSYLGKVSLDTQNHEEQFWKSEKIKLKLNDGVYVNEILTNKTIDYIKAINYKNTYIKKEQRNKLNGKLSNANIIKILKCENDYKQINQINDIYEEKNKKLEEILIKNFNDLLIYKGDKETYNLLKEIYLKYKDEKYYNQESKKKEDINPFKHYCLVEHDIDINDFDSQIHGIRPISKNNKTRPIIKKLKFVKKITTPFILNKDNINIKEDHYIGLDSLSQWYTEVYYSAKNQKYYFMPIYRIMTKIINGKLIIDKNNRFYQQCWEEYIVKKSKNVDDLIKILDVKTNDYIEIQKKDGTICSGLYSGFHKNKKCLELKNKYAFSSSDKSIKKINLGKLGILDIQL